jgi:membrane protein
MDAKSRAADAEQLYARAKERFDRSAAGLFRNRLTEAEVSKKALILAALSLMLFIPALVSLLAVLPLGSDHGLAPGVARHLGLNTRARHDLQQLFGTRKTVQGSTTVLSAIVTVVFAYGWPAELRRGYEFIWRLPPQGVREIWRPLAWLVVFFLAIATLAGISSIWSGTPGTILERTLQLPLMCLWALWSLHLLLGGRIPYRTLLVSGVITGACLIGYGAFSSWYLPRNIVENFDRYGPIGVVFAMLSWMIGFSVVMLGGPLVGQMLHQHRLERAAGK